MKVPFSDRDSSSEMPACDETFDELETLGNKKEGWDPEDIDGAKFPFVGQGRRPAEREDPQRTDGSLVADQPHTAMCERIYKPGGVAAGTLPRGDGALDATNALGSGRTRTCGSENSASAANRGKEAVGPVHAEQHEQHSMVKQTSGLIGMPQRYMIDDRVIKEGNPAAKLMFKVTTGKA